jgi:hypothetical protein
MKQLTFCSSLFAAFIACRALAADVSGPIIPTERIDLFNGKDFSGWTFCLRSNTPPAETFAVSNGLMHCTGQPFGYVRTEKAFRDYKLTVEWRFVKVAPHADNSGVFVHLQGPDKVWPQCIENQGQYRHQGDFIFMGGAAYKGTNGVKQGSLKMQAPSNEKAPGEWNTYEVICQGDTLKNYMNGKLMNQAQGCSPNSGAIAMQSEGGEWELRKIYVEPVTQNR